MNVQFESDEEVSDKQTVPVSSFFFFSVVKVRGPLLM